MKCWYGREDFSGQRDDRTTISQWPSTDLYQHSIKAVANTVPDWTNFRTHLPRSSLASWLWNAEHSSCFQQWQVCHLSLAQKLLPLPSPHCFLVASE